MKKIEQTATRGVTGQGNPKARDKVLGERVSSEERRALHIEPHAVLPGVELYGSSTTR